MSPRQAFLVVVDQADTEPSVDAARIAAALADRTGGLVGTVTVDALDLDLGAHQLDQLGGLPCYGGEPCTHCPDPGACGELSARRSTERSELDKPAGAQER